MTKYGTIKYGMQLCIMEICTLGSIFVFKLMIDYLQEMKEDKEQSKGYAFVLFFFFSVLRLISLLTRSYYDQHVYVYFRFC